MIYIDAIIYSGKLIGTEEVARRIFEILNENGLCPDKIGPHEPIREPFSLEKAIEMWTESGQGYHQVAGGMLGKKKKPNFLFKVYWAKGPRARLNYLSFFIAKTSFTANRNIFEKVFRDIYLLVEGVYGYITREELESRQHVTGSIETRMSGVFWCNYFGTPYVEFFGKEKILSGPWVKTELLDFGTIVTYLSNDPNDTALVESDALEMSAKKHLGIEFFGDPEQRHEQQFKEVPKLELPTIRVPLD